MTLNLEIGDGVKLEEITHALSLIAQSEITSKDSSLEAYFPRSNVSISAKTDLSDRSALTEELEDVDWKLGMRIYFDIDPTLPNALDEIKEFVFALSEITSAHFALSFEYETLYAKRGKNGLVLSDVF
jgi:hypothetical protein